MPISACNNLAGNKESTHRKTGSPFQSSRLDLPEYSPANTQASGLMAIGSPTAGENVIPPEAPRFYSTPITQPPKPPLGEVVLPMSDLVERLREGGPCAQGGVCLPKGKATPGFCICEEAADHIASLESQVAEQQETIREIAFMGTSQPAALNMPEGDWYRRIVFDCIRIAARALPEPPRDTHE